MWPICPRRRVASCLTNALSHRLLNEVGISLARASCRSVRPDADDSGRSRGSDGSGRAAGLTAQTGRSGLIRMATARTRGRKCSSRNLWIAPASGRARLPCCRRPLARRYTGAVYTDPDDVESIIACRSQTLIAAEAGPGIDRASATTRTICSIPNTSWR